MELKSNFHTKEWIMERVRHHYKCAVSNMGSENYIIGAFLVGSQNYQLDVESSDVDVKVFTLPSIESIIELSKPESFVWVGEDGEHEDIKDFRLVIKELQKGSPNMLETLFTDYYVVNPKYARNIAQLRAYRERIAYINPDGLFNAEMGMARRFFKLYDEGRCGNKEIATVLRIRDFLTSYFLDGKKYKESLVSPNIAVLRGIRTNGGAPEKLKGLVEEARKDIEVLGKVKPNEQISPSSFGVLALRDIQYTILYEHLERDMNDFKAVPFSRFINEYTEAK